MDAEMRKITDRIELLEMAMKGVSGFTAILAAALYTRAVSGYSSYFSVLAAVLNIPECRNTGSAGCPLDSDAMEAVAETAGVGYEVYLAVLGLVWLAGATIALVVDAWLRKKRRGLRVDSASSGLSK